MHKPSKVEPLGQLVTTSRPAIKRLWIGVDLGDRSSEVCILNSRGDVKQRASIRTTRTAVREYFGAFAGARIAIETGTQSPWMSRLLTECGLKALR